MTTPPHDRPMSRRDEFAKAVASAMKTSWQDASLADEHARRIVILADALIAELDKLPPSTDV